MDDQGKRRLFTAYLFAFMAAFALSGTMFSTVLPRIIEDYRLSLAQVGLFSVFQSAGSLLAMLLTGLIGDRMKKAPFIGAIFLAMGVLLSLVSLMPPFWALLVVLGILGLSGSALNLMVTAYIADLYSDARARYISLLHVWFGIGSLLGPLYPMLLSKAGLLWDRAYLALGIAVLLCSGGYFLSMARLGAPSEGHSQTVRSQSIAMHYKDLFKYSGMPALCAICFLYMGGHQGAFSTWFQTYLQATNPSRFSAEFTSVCMTIYWIGMVVSRMLGASFSHKTSPRGLLLVGSALGASALAMGLLIGQNWSWVLAVVLMGLATGIIYPLTFTIGCEWFPNNSARVSSFVGISSALGSICFGWAIGAVAEHSFLSAMWIQVATLALVFSIALMLFPRHARDGGSRHELDR